MIQNKWFFVLLTLSAMHFTACSSKSKNVGASQENPVSIERAATPSPDSPSVPPAQAELQETEKEILAKMNEFKENITQLKMYCKKAENSKRTHHFLFFERAPGKEWTAKVYTEYFGSKGKKLSTKMTTEFPVLRTDDIVQSTEEASQRQFYLEFPTINSIAEVKLRARYQGDRTPQSFVPKEKKLNDVQCYEQY